MPPQDSPPRHGATERGLSPMTSPRPHVQPWLTPARVHPDRLSYRHPEHLQARASAADRLSAPALLLAELPDGAPRVPAPPAPGTLCRWARSRASSARPSAFRAPAQCSTPAVAPLPPAGPGCACSRAAAWACGRGRRSGLRPQCAHARRVKGQALPWVEAQGSLWAKRGLQDQSLVFPHPALLACES